jgi:lysyl endopeptidase
VAVEAESASALRVHITDFNLPENAALYIYNTDNEAFGPYTGLGPHQDGEFWTNTVFGSLAYVQLHYSGSAPDAIRCRVAGVGVVGPKFLIPFMQKPTRDLPGLSNLKTLCSYNEPCVEDATCYGSGTYPAINDHKYAAAHMMWVSGVWIYMCSGALLNNTANDYTPYFLTANHCISKQKAATSLECYFQYWTASCEGACYDPVGVCPRTLGATLLAGSKKESDFSLLRLNQSAPAGSVFLGWSTTPLAFNDGFEIYRISYPSGAPQAFSKHEVDSDFVECRSWPVGKWIYSYDLIGATEPGSSGSPVCNASGQVVGQLSGACGYNVNEVCDADNNRTVDGAFANYYALISQWLDPN